MDVPIQRLMVGWTTCDSETTAEKLAQQAVEKKLAACVQISGPITSHYEWQGKVEKAREWSLAFKFPTGNAKQIKAWLVETHPYNCPQWYTIAADEVHPPYLDWVLQTTGCQ